MTEPRDYFLKLPRKGERFVPQHGPFSPFPNDTMTEAVERHALDYCGEWRNENGVCMHGGHDHDLCTCNEVFQEPGCSAHGVWQRR